MNYTASSQALAVLEMLVHLESSELLKHYRLIPVTFDQKMVTILDAKKLPANWKHRPTPASVRAIGDQWIASQISVVMQVPSTVVPNESNYLLDVGHPDFAKLVIGKPQAYRFDSRLG